QQHQQPSQQHQRPHQASEAVDPYSRYDEREKSRKAHAEEAREEEADDPQFKPTTHYTDTRLLHGHEDDQEYLEHAYTQGNMRHTSTPRQVSFFSGHSATATST